MAGASPGHERSSAREANARSIHLRENFLDLRPGFVPGLVGHLPGGVGTLERSALRGLELGHLHTRTRLREEIEVAAPGAPDDVLAFRRQGESREQRSGVGMRRV